MKQTIVDIDKKKVGEADLLDEVFAKPVNSALLYEAVRMQLSSRRQGDAFCGLWRVPSSSRSPH